MLEEIIFSKMVTQFELMLPPAGETPKRLRIAFVISNAGNGNHQKARAKVSGSEKYNTIEISRPTFLRSINAGRNLFPVKFRCVCGYNFVRLRESPCALKHTGVTVFTVSWST